MLCGWIVPLKTKLTVPAKDARRILTLCGFDCNDEGTLVWAITSNDVINPMPRSQFLKLCDATGGGMSVHTSLARPFALSKPDDIIDLHTMSEKSFRILTRQTKRDLVDLYSCLKDLGCVNETSEVPIVNTAIAISNKKPKELTAKEIRKQKARAERKAKRAEVRKQRKKEGKLDTPSVKPNVPKAEVS